MKRIASSLVFAVTLVVALTASLAWTGHAAAQTDEPVPPAALNLDLTIQTADGEVITLPLRIDDETFVALSELTPTAMILEAMGQLARRELLTITVAAPTVITPAASILLFEPVDGPLPPMGAPLAVAGRVTATRTTTATVSEAVTAAVAVNLPPAEEVEPPIVTAAANLRTSPSTSAAIIGQIAANSPVTLTGRNSDGSWLQIDDGSWVVGFVVQDAPAGLPIVLEGGTAVSETVPATVTGGAVVLRAGPSQTDESLGAYEEGVVTAVLSRAPDDGWLEVLMPDGNVGWMSADFLEIAEALEGLPTVISTVTSSITGRVVDAAGEGIGDIVIAATQTGGQAVPRVDATTASDGAFTLYLTPGEATEWTVGISGVGCDSRIVNDRCQLFGYFASVPEVTVTAPMTEPVTLVYEDATSFIAGTVLSADGEPVGDGIGVIGVREDGARTAGLTSSTGKFVLPASAGVWTIETDNGPSLEVEVPERSAPEPVDLQLE